MDQRHRAAGAAWAGGRRLGWRGPGRAGEAGAGVDKEALAAWRARSDAERAEPLAVVRVGGPDEEILRRPARPVRHVNRSVRTLIERMRATMYHENGVGLAAPQVGVDQRVLVADAGDHHCVLVNPEVVLATGTQTEPLEGCLSIPDLLGEVERSETIRVRGLDANGREVWVDASGYFARVLQHEVDHLDGILFTDRASRIVPVRPETKLDVVFMGTADFGARVLRQLVAADVIPVLVVTQPDRPAGRGLHLQSTPVRVAADEAGLEVVTPPGPRDADLWQRLRDLEPDVVVSAAYGGILPGRVLDLPRLGAVNVHPSLLPRYRGPDPVRRALWNGDAETGVTIQRMARQVDAGDILRQEVVPVDPDDNAGALTERLAEIGGRLLLRALRDLATERAAPQSQDAASATQAPKIRPEEEVSDFEPPAAVLAARARALAPRPSLRTPGGLKLLEVRALAESSSEAPGTVVGLRKDQGLAVATGQGVLLLRRVQAPGGRPLDALEWARGRRLTVGQRLE